MTFRISAFAVCACLGLVWGQITVTNEELIKLNKAGMSEDFIVGIVDKEPQKLSSDVNRLIALKEAGLSDRIPTAVIRKAPAAEPLASPGLAQLAGAGFQEPLLLEIVAARKPKIDTSPSSLISLKEAKLSEQVIGAVIENGNPVPAMDAAAVLALAKAGFSEGFLIRRLQEQKNKPPLTAAQIVELKKAGVSEQVLAAMVDRASPVEIPAGTAVAIRLIDAIDSSKHNEGEKFKASLEEPLIVNGETVAPKGADAIVTLAAEKNSGRFTGRTQLTVRLESITIGGREVSVQSTTVTQESRSQTTSTAKRAAIVGAAGAVIGGIAGGGRGAAIGAGAGAGVGAGSQVFTKGQRVQIPSETVLRFTLENALTVR